MLKYAMLMKMILFTAVDIEKAGTFLPFSREDTTDTRWHPRISENLLYGLFSGILTNILPGNFLFLFPQLRTLDFLIGIVCFSILIGSQRSTNPQLLRYNELKVSQSAGL